MIGRGNWVVNAIHSRMATGSRCLNVFSGLRFAVCSLQSYFAGASFT
jgi:hypothetical protein